MGVLRAFRAFGSARAARPSHRARFVFHAWPVQRSHQTIPSRDAELVKMAGTTLKLPGFPDGRMAQPGAICKVHPVPRMGRALGSVGAGTRSERLSGATNAPPDSTCNFPQLAANVPVG